MSSPKYAASLRWTQSTAESFPPPGNTPYYAQWRAIRTRDWLFAASGHRESGDRLHYDMQRDPYQQRNLAVSEPHRAVRDEFGAKLALWPRRTGDAIDIQTDFPRRPRRIQSRTRRQAE